MTPAMNPRPTGHIHRGIRERKIISRIEIGMAAKAIEMG
jgi:hypothetical protein